MVALTGLINADLYADGLLTIDVPHKLTNRGELFSAGGFSSIELPALSGTGLDTGEPNAAGYTDTIWYELPITPDLYETVRIQLVPNGNDASISVYWSSVADPANDIDPTYASLTLIQAAAVDQVVTIDPNWQSIYLQIGSDGSPDNVMTLSWGDGDPEEGGTFASAYEIDDDFGHEDGDIFNAWLESGEPVPAGISALRSVWFKWLCPNPAPEEMVFTATTTTPGDFGLAVYQGASVGALTTIVSGTGTGPGGQSVTFSPATAGSYYYIQITSEATSGTYRLSWEANEDTPVAPAEIFDYVSVRIFDRNGVNLITEVKNRKDVQFQESLNTPGTGQFTMPLPRPGQWTEDYNSHILNITPYPLQDGNIVKFFFGNTCVSAFRIADLEYKLSSSGEGADRMVTVSGPTLHQMLDDFIVCHEEHGLDTVNVGLGNQKSKDERTFSWASGVFPDFVAADWDDQTNLNSRSNPPGGKPGAAPKDRPKYGNPKKWPASGAYWMWLSQTPSKNENNYNPPRQMGGKHYYRKTFVITSAKERVRMWSSSDDYHEVWLDGEKVIESNQTETGYKSFSTFTTWLEKGRHTIAVHVRDLPNGGDGSEAFIFACATLDRTNKIKKYLARSNRAWYIWQGPNPPAWKRASILWQVYKEAQGRSNTAALALNDTFGVNTDSSGKPWKKDRVNMSVKVGTSALDLQSQLSESGQLDVWINPHNMTFNAYSLRGSDLTSSVSLDIGTNLGEYSYTRSNRVKNRIMIQCRAGLVWAYFPNSINTYGQREGYVELGGIRDKNWAKKVVSNASKTVGESRESAGAPDVSIRPVNEPKNSLIAVEGAFPFLDFNVGDRISAPDQFGNKKKFRVLSLSCSESDDGVLTFEPELEPWGQ